MLEPNEAQEIRDELKEIQEEMLDLLGQARYILKGTPVESQAEAYWLANIESDLVESERYIGGGSMVGLHDTLEELDRFINQDPEMETYS